MADVSQFFSQVESKVNRDKIQGMNAVYQFDVTGEGGGQHWVKVANGEVETGQGIHDTPNITLTISAEDFEKLVTGQLNGQTAFLTGKLKIKGDMTLAMKLGSVFGLS